MSNESDVLLTAPFSLLPGLQEELLAFFRGTQDPTTRSNREGRSSHAKRIERSFEGTG